MGEQRDYGDETDFRRLDKRDPRLVPAKPYSLTVDDKRFLQSLRIVAE
jgi:hypothetical protein